MSSFICNKTHFNSIEKSVKMLAYGNQYSFPYPFKAIFPELYAGTCHNYMTGEIEKCITSIVDTLRQLNVLCVSLQYKHHYEGVLDNEIKEQTESLMSEKTSGKILNKVALYKALCCLSYQIETEHLKELRELTQDEVNAMFFLKEMKIDLSATIISELPAYDNAAWEIN